MSVALLDANVLIALLDPEHQHHDAAHVWLSTNIAVGFAVCPLVENACLRIMCQPSYPKRLPFDMVRARLQSLRTNEACNFWADSVSLVDKTYLAAGTVLALATVTDTYLLALAVKHNGRLATFDQRIAWQTVAGATSRSLWVLL
jgi:uncharacterized protein